MKPIFVFNKENWKTLEFIGDKKVKYGDVASGSGPLALAIGNKHDGTFYWWGNATMHLSMLIFKNKARFILPEVLQIQNMKCATGHIKKDGGLWGMETVPLSANQWLAGPRANNKKLGPYWGRYPHHFAYNCLQNIVDDQVDECLGRIKTSIRKMSQNPSDIV